jgi:hypothetical protein
VSKLAESNTAIYPDALESLAFVIFFYDIYAKGKHHNISLFLRSCVRAIESEAGIYLSKKAGFHLLKRTGPSTQLTNFIQPIFVE